jgi:hypothetical protein
VKDVALHWFRTESGRTDHLARGPGPEETWLAWCGYDLRRAIEAIGNGPKCGLCLRALQAYTQQALVEWPDVVSEAFLVQVTRPAGGGADVADLITRKLAAHRTWQVTVTPYHVEQ